jgi:hypothetical protein
VNIFNFLRMIVFFAAFLTLNNYSQTKTDGWEEGSRYNRLYSNKTDTLTGIVLTVTHISPMPGMAEGVQLKVLSGTDTVTVQLCPKWMSTYLNLDIQPKQEVVIEGCKAICHGNHVFMASKLTANSLILQLRDEKGVPIWDRLR